MENNNTADSNSNAQNSGFGMMDALAALQAIESAIGAEESGKKASDISFDIPFSDVLTIMPDEFISNTDDDPVQKDTIKISV